MKRWVSRLAVILIVVAVAVAFLKNAIVKHSVTAGVRAMTGLQLDIDRMQVGVLRSLVTIEGLKLLNPPGYPDRVMVEMPEIHVDYHLGHILKGTTHLEEVRLNLREVTIVKNASGELNLDAVRRAMQKPASRGQARTPSEPQAPPPGLQIDVLQLAIGTVVFKDYSRGEPVKVQTFPVNINERFTHITDTRMLVGVITTKTLAKTAIARLANIDLSVFEGQMAAALDGARAAATQAQAMATQTMTQGTDAAQQAKAALDAAADSVGGAAKDLLKTLPFGRSSE